MAISSPRTCGRGAILLSVVLLSGLILLPGLGAFPLWDPWEPHYTQVAWEMGRHHTLLEPIYRDSTNWSSKPIFMFWLLRASLGLFWDSVNDFGNHAFAARLPFALAAVLGAALTYDWVRRLFSTRAGLLAALVLVTCPQYVLIGRQVMADMVMVVAHSAALGYLAVALFSRRTDGAVAQGSAFRSRGPLLAFWGLSAIAVLTKGFLPLLLTLLTLLVALVSTVERWRPTRAELGGSLPRYLSRCAVRLAALFGGLLLCAWWVHRHTELTSEQAWLVRLGWGALGVIAALFVLRALPPVQHLARFLRESEACWGVPVFLLIAAPWYVYITFARGWHYWHTFIFFHHLGRAEGTISLPTQSFEYTLKNLAFALFPWTGLLVPLLGVLLVWSHPRGRSFARRSWWLLVAALVPSIFFMVSRTKFGHYGFPAVPFLAALLGVAIDRLLTESSMPERRDKVSWTVIGIVGALSTLVLLFDITADYRHILRLFVYYANRPAPFPFQPEAALFWLTVPALGSFVVLAVRRRCDLVGLTGLGVSAVGLAMYVSWVMMPRAVWSYTYQPVIEAFDRLSGPNDHLGQYANWATAERSVLFLSQSRAELLASEPAASIFLTRPGHKYLIVERRRVEELKRLGEKVKVPLHVVFDAHPTARLLSDVPVARSVPRITQGESEPGLTRVDAELDGRIRWHGYRIERDRLRPGETLALTLNFEAVAPIREDLEVVVALGRGGKAAPLLTVSHAPASGRHPTRRWCEGQVVVDRTVLALPKTLPKGPYHLWVGFADAAGRRVPVTSRGHLGHERLARGPALLVE